MRNSGRRRFFLRLVLSGLASMATSLTAVADGGDPDRAQRYVRLAQIDPLYAWPGVDLEHMEQAILALEASRAEILRFAEQYGPAQRQRIGLVLYPTGYLAQMRELERQRRALSAGADTDQLHAYQGQLIRTIQAHRSALTDLVAALSATSQEVSYKGLDYHFGRSSFAHFIGGIEAYLAQATRSLEQAETRWQCLRTQTSDCETPDWRLVGQPRAVTYDVRVFDQPAAGITRAIRENGRIGGQSAGPGWAMLNGSDCLDADGPVPFLTWVFPTGSGVPIFRPEVVTDVLVHDHRIDEDSNAYERILDSLGMDGYLFQPHTNLYACPDAAGDSARLRAMVFLHGFAGRFDASVGHGTRKDLAASLARVSKALSALRDADVLTEFATEHAAHEAGKLLAMFERDALVLAWGDDRVEQLEGAVLTYRLRTAGLSQDVMNLVYGNTAIADYVPYAPWGFLEELLFTRNGPELLLGGTNPSVIRENYPQIEQYRDGVSPRLQSYVEDLSSRITPAEMVEILLDGLKAEYRLARFQDRPYLFAE